MHFKFTFIILFTFVTADYLKAMEEVDRIDKRLRTIEDNIAEERIQRREDVQSVLNKLSELQNSVQNNYRTKQENGNEFNGKYERTVMDQIKMAFAIEKQANQRLRREIQSMKLDQSSNITNRFASFERQLFTMASKQNDFIQRSEDFVTKGDLPTVVNGISRVTNRISADMEKTIMPIIKGQVDNIAKMMDNLIKLQQHIHSTEGTCQNADNKLEKFKRLGVTTLTTNLYTPSDAECLANLVDKSKTEFSSCMELKYAGFSKSGVYKIKVKHRYLRVYCDQTTEGGGWIVFQRRKDGSVDFYRTWNEYKHGFGDLEGEFWLGNENLADLTNACCHELRVDLGDVDGNTRYAEYNEFRVLDEGSLYELKVGTYSGTAGDDLTYHNKRKFSTKDSDNDMFEDYNCASGWKGAWWFAKCYNAHLNGKYQANGIREKFESRISWNSWKNKIDNGKYHSLTFSEMKFR